MSRPAVGEAAAPAESFITQLRSWWHRYNELGNLPREELERVAGEFGMTGREFKHLAAKGPHAADLLYERLDALGISPSDKELMLHGLMRDLQKNCACCSDKAECKKDLASRPDDPVWKDYCPNSVTLVAISEKKMEPTRS